LDVEGRLAMRWTSRCIAWNIKSNS